jgi:hypothetical protein
VNASKTYDVFISHSARDAALALEVANACRGAGIEAVTNGDLLPGADASDALWEALAESRALLTIVSPSGPTPSMAIEIGAARAWNKPIYAVVTDPSSARLPAALSGIRLYTVGKIEDVIRAIESSVRQLTDEDRAILVNVYAELDTSADQLALDPRQLGDLMKRFERRTGKAVPGERLLSELLRLRKQGKLLRNRPVGRVRSKREPA